MRQEGYFLIDIGKCLNLYLWSENKADLEESLESGMQIVPYYKDENNNGFIELNGKMIRIKS